MLPPKIKKSYIMIFKKTFGEVALEQRKMKKTEKSKTR
tara:strand:- start:437 stop:550 length:114 start_codon:yes stop_codon:yes gene_type:complete